jgi:tetratricopeptide (TPR) repeat protein
MAAPAKPPRAAASRSPHPAWIALALVAAAFVAYLPALHAQYIWDDEAYVTGNETLRTPGGLLKIWLEPWATPQYYPLVHTSFWIEYRLWQLDPAGYHAVNIAIHALNGILVLLLLRRLQVPGAALAAALFTLHPVHVESVAWVTERKNVLSAFFYLAAMLVYLRFRPVGERAVGARGKEAARPRGEGSAVLYGIAFLLFVAALLSKTVTASLPGALLVIVWWKEGRLTVRDVLRLVPFFLLGLAAGISTAWLEKHRVGAYGDDWTLTGAQRLLIAGRAVWFYLGKLLWPHPLVFIYPRWELDVHSALQWAFPVAAVVLLGVLFAFRGRIGRGPLAAALFFGGTLVPALGFFDVYPMRYSFVADHFQYLASLGVLTLVVAAATWAVSEHWPGRVREARAGAALWLLALGTVTYVECHHYHDYETLWIDTLAKNTRCWMAYNNLGLLYEKRGQMDKAIEQYQRALSGKPDSADAHTNLGNVLLGLGRRAEALPHLREAVRLSPDSPEAWNNLGGGLTEEGQAKEALECYRKAAALDPDDGRLRLNYGSALTLAGDLEAAVVELRAAGRRLPGALLPHLGAAHFNLGNALFQKEHVALAEDQYRLALEARPDDVDARINLGYTLVRRGRGPEALPLFREALARDPQSKRAHAGLMMIGAADEH